ncbi:hypothetical protein KP509_13G091100 [Ceratopteris richardii]|uniref:Uncharacterized protein n=1 Tax=Ceratopteris richardii TaxID=49495 RepID=A0A8T2TL53_CERRI|nr:hypothetical protein KP509_13G091100 [Ceratopteris richardii]
MSWSTSRSREGTRAKIVPQPTPRYREGACLPERRLGGRADVAVLASTHGGLNDTPSGSIAIPSTRGGDRNHKRERRPELERYYYLFIFFFFLEAHLQSGDTCPPFAISAPRDTCLSPAIPVASDTCLPRDLPLAIPVSPPRYLLDDTRPSRYPPLAILAFPPRYQLLAIPLA